MFDHGDAKPNTPVITVYRQHTPEVVPERHIKERRGSQARSCDGALNITQPGHYTLPGAATSLRPAICSTRRRSVSTAGEKMRGHRGPSSCLNGWSSTLGLTLALGLCLGVSPLGSAPQRISRPSKIDRAVQKLLTNGSGADPVRVIIRAHETAARETLKNRLRAHGDHIEADHASIDAFTATVHGADLDGLVDDPATDGISIDAVVTPHQSTSNTLLGTEVLPDSGANGSNARIAIIDSGLEITTDLPSSRVLGFYDLTRGDQVVSVPPYDDYGHGTHVAGLIAGSGANSKGLYAGIAPAAKLLVLKVLDRNGSGYTSDVIQAIDFVIANQKTFAVNVINLSLGHPIFESAATDPLVLEVQKATQAGIIVVVAAGNYGQDPTTGLPGYGGITSPGNAPSAITVGAVKIQNTVPRSDDRIADYSSAGPTWYDAYAKPDVVSPGHNIVAV